MNLLPDIWSILVEAHVTHKQYLPPLNKAREGTVHYSIVLVLVLVFLLLPSLHQGVIPVQLPK